MVSVDFVSLVERIFVLILKDVEGYRINEIAKIVGITEQNVKSRLHRARIAIKTILKKLFKDDSSEK